MTAHPAASQPARRPAGRTDRSRPRRADTPPTRSAVRTPAQMPARTSGRARAAETTATAHPVGAPTGGRPGAHSPFARARARLRAHLFGAPTPPAPTRAPTTPTDAGATAPTGTAPHRAAGRVAVTLAGFGLLLVLVSGRGLRGLLLATVGVWVVLYAPSAVQRLRFQRAIYQRTHKITKDEEYEADLRQNRRWWWLLLTGRIRAAAWAVFPEFRRARANPHKYVRVWFAADAPWRPTVDHIIRVRRRWPPNFEGNYLSQLDRIRKQIAAYLGGNREVLLDIEPDHRRCWADFTRAAATDDAGGATVSKLPTRLLYPDQEAN